MRERDLLDCRGRQPITELVEMLFWRERQPITELDEMLFWRGSQTITEQDVLYCRGRQKIIEK